MEYNFGGRGPTAVQFDLKGKQTRDLTPEELEANLRSHGCPARLVARAVERHSKRYGYSRKEPAAQHYGRVDDPPKAKIEERVANMLALLQKAARAVGKALTHSEASGLLESQRYTSPTYQSDDHTCTSPTSCYHCMRGHLRTAYDLAECSYVIATQVNDMLDSWPGANGDGDMEEDSLRSMTPKAKAKLHNAVRRMHRDAHRQLGEVCEMMGRVGLTAEEIED